MTRLRLAFVVLLLSLPAAAYTQRLQPPNAPQQPERPEQSERPQRPERPERPARPERPEQPERPDDVDVFTRSTRNAIRLGQDFRLASGDAVRDAVVVFGDATIAGEVDGNLVVVFGAAHLARTAVLRGDFVSVGGSVTVDQGASARRDFVVVGGDLDAPADFMPAGGHVVFGGGPLRDVLQGLRPYLTRGLLWGRLIVPDVEWMWGIVAMFLGLYVGMNLLFAAPVRASATTLAARPLTSFGVGLLVLLLIGPICLLLAVSVVGLAVVPFVLLAMVGGWAVGKVAVARSLGMTLMEENSDSRVQGTRSVLIGFVLISIAYLMPVLGLATWAIGGVVGLGASTLAFLSAYRRERPKRVSESPDIPPPPVPATYTPPPPEVALPPLPSTASSFVATEPEPAMAYERLGVPPAGAAAAAIPLAGAPPSLLAAMPRALFRDRAAAVLLDVVLLVVLINIFSLDPDEFAPLIVLGYHIGFWTWKQTTVGGIVCQVRVVRTDGARLTFADALVRGLASIFSVAVFFIGALWILRDPERQAWHDKIAGTYVVKVPRGWPL